MSDFQGVTRVIPEKILQRKNLRNDTLKIVEFCGKLSWAPRKDGASVRKVVCEEIGRAEWRKRRADFSVCTLPLLQKIYES